MTSWKSRPSPLFSRVTYSTLPVATLKNQYTQDCKRANEDGVKIRPRSTEALIRTLQWNIHAWTTAHDEESSKITNGFMDSIFDVDADVVILNEYHWGETDCRHADFEQELRSRGYALFCGTVECPTAVATRLRVLEAREVRLSAERSALALLVATPEMENIWVIGTHLDHLDGDLRKKEISILLEDLKSNVGEDERIIVAGDFNQQRQQDYTPVEWKRISDSMKRRYVCEDDGVSAMLQNMKFKCAWSDLSFPDCNWETIRPPATHWSGTVIDYSYGRNVVSVRASISPAGWSDHRMTVCDWNW
jgi:endonuclease/exonuclease/phosphatase family metal-dependent hydrolase